MQRNIVVGIALVMLALTTVGIVVLIITNRTIVPSGQFVETPALVTQPSNAAPSLLSQPTTQAVSADIPMDWKIYTNGDLGIVFSYPPDASVDFQDGTTTCVVVKAPGISVQISFSAECFPLMTGVGIGTEIRRSGDEKIVFNGKEQSLELTEYITSTEFEKSDFFAGNIAIDSATSLSYSYTPEQKVVFQKILQSLSKK